MEFFDTHCHIHEALTDTDGDEFVREKWAKAGQTDPKLLISDAVSAGVTRMIAVGCTLKDSKLAVKLAIENPNCWASIGIHPHEAKDHLSPSIQKSFTNLLKTPETPNLPTPSRSRDTPSTDKTVRGSTSHMRVVAIGECGLDYHYNHSVREDQVKVLEFQLGLAQEYDLPVIFHVRDAFDDFWPIFDNFKGLRGVIHSFSSNMAGLEQILSRGLYVGLNGIMTFTKNKDQLVAARAIPLNRLLLETDAPFLTPAPLRGTICLPKHVVLTAEFLAGLREEKLADLAKQTTQNACNLFFQR